MDVVAMVLQKKIEKGNPENFMYDADGECLMPGRSPQLTVL